MLHFKINHVGSGGFRVTYVHAGLHHSLFGPFFSPIARPKWPNYSLTVLPLSESLRQQTNNKLEQIPIQQRWYSNHAFNQVLVLLAWLRNYQKNAALFNVGYLYGPVSRNKRQINFKLSRRKEVVVSTQKNKKSFALLVPKRSEFRAQAPLKGVNDKIKCLRN